MLHTCTSVRVRRHVAKIFAEQISFALTGFSVFALVKRVLPLSSLSLWFLQFSAIHLTLRYNIWECCINSQLVVGYVSQLEDSEVVHIDNLGYRWKFTE